MMIETLHTLCEFKKYCLSQGTSPKASDADVLPHVLPEVTDATRQSITFRLALTRLSAMLH